MGTARIRPAMAWTSVPRAYESRLLRRKNVVGVGIARKVVGGRQTNEPCIVVFVERKLPTSQLGRKDLIPDRIETMKTDVIETGRIVALQSRTVRVRPAPGGVSIGHFRITAGTLGVVVPRSGVRVILSNNHVLANSNDGRRGDAILQPGAHDGGTANDQIATLEDFVRIVFDGFLDWLLALFGIVRTAPNVVDAAVARPLRDTDVSNDVLEIGPVSGTASATIDMPIRKSGRTTGLTQGRVTAIAATVRVSYGLTRMARFRDQIVATAMSQGGDSGSLVVDSGNRAVGLLFAGSSNTTILNPITAVASQLGLQF
jgi:hypothetical protein